MSVTEVAEYVAPSFRIQNTCFLKTFQCEVKVGCKTSFTYKGGSLFTTEIVNNFVFLQNRRILIKANSVFKNTSILPVTPLRVYK